MKKPLIISTWKWGKPANEEAAQVLNRGGSLLDAIEKGINKIELDPSVTSVGYGSMPNEDGILQLDAAIMDGRDHSAGAVAALEKIATPISVARRVMEKTKHVFICGDGALQFALREGFEPRELLTKEIQEIWQKMKANPKRESFWKGRHSDTITMIILDQNSDLAAGGSTSGRSFKISGRVSDTSFIGAGIYVDNQIGAAAATGNGDEIMKYGTSIKIVENMRNGLSPQAACEAVLRYILEKHPSNKDEAIGVIAVNKKGDYGAVSMAGTASVANGFTYALWTPDTNDLRTASEVS